MFRLVMRPSSPVLLRNASSESAGILSVSDAVRRSRLFVYSLELSRYPPYWLSSAVKLAMLSS